MKKLFILCIALMANFFVKAECDPNGSDTTAVVCGSFTWYGEVYNGSTTAFHTLTNQGGCDSIITLFLTIIPSTNFSIVNNGSPCLNSVLSVTGGDLSELNNISWLLNGDTITNVPPAVTVARTFTPWGLSVDNNRNVYVADASDGRVQKWAPGATAGVTVAGGNGNYSSGPADLSGPRGIFKDADDTLYVVDGYNNRIQKWAPGATEGVTVAGGNGGGSNLNQFDQPQDVYVDLDRNVYVTEYNNSRVVKWAPGATEGVIVAGGNGYGPNLNQIARPVGIWLDNNLNIYVSDFQYHRIVKWAPNATVGVVVAGITNEPGSDEFHLNQPYDVYGDRDGNIYVADLNNQRIQKFSSNSTGGDAGITVAGGNGEGPNNDQFWNTLSVHVDSIGNIYVSDQINQRVQKWFKQGLPDTYVPTALGNYSVAYTNIYGCTGTSNEIAVSIPTDSIATVSACGSYEWIDGNTYTYSTNDPSFNAGPNAAGCDSTIYLHLTIYPIASDTFVYTCGDSFTWYGVTYNATPTVKPTKIFINEFGCDSTVTLNLTIFPRAEYTLSNLGTDCLNDAQLQINGAGLEDINKIEWLLDGNLVSTTAREGVTVAGGDFGSNLNQFGGYMLALAFDATENLYVVDEANSRVQKFLPNSVGGDDGETVAGGNIDGGSLPNELFYPQRMALDADGNIYVVDNGNNRIQKFPPNSTGATDGVTVVGGTDGVNDILDYPRGIALDADGNIYVSDNSHRVQKFPPTSTINTPGVIVAGGNGYGDAANQLAYPHGIFIGADRSIYIADNENYRIQKWALGATEGVTVAGGYYGNNANQLSYPDDVFVDADENIYVADNDNNRIQKFTPGASAGITVAGGNGFANEPGSLVYPSGVYVDASGNIYVGDAGNARVQKWSKAALPNTYTPTTEGTYTAIVTTQSGCSVTTNAITFATTESIETVNACTSYTWNDSTYTENPLEIPIHTFKSSTGCDSTVSLYLTINYPPATADVEGLTSVYVDSVITLTNIPPGQPGSYTGIWESADESIAIVDENGNVTGIAPGTVNIYYVITSVVGGCKDSTFLSIDVIANPLPVRLISLSAQSKDNTHALVSWTSVSEINLHHYIVERSTDGQKFYNRGQVISKGSASTSASYEFNDELNMHSPVYYYRLKMVNNDGSFNYSSIVTVKVNESLYAEGFDVYPNPFMTACTIQYNSLTEEKVTITMRSINGTIVERRVVGVHEGNNNIQLTGINKLSSGSYLIELKSTRGKLFKQVIKK